MTTRLGQLVDFMACRADEASEAIREELADPGADAGRWLAAARALTRGAFEDRALQAFDLRPAPPAAAAEDGARAGPGRLARIGRAAAAALIAAAVGAAWWAERADRRRLEAAIAGRDEALAGRLRRLEESAGARPEAGEGRLAIALERLGRMTEAVARLDRRLGEIRPRGDDPSGPALAELRLAMAREEAALRRLEGRLDGLGPAAGGAVVREKPAVDAARIDLILARLQELSQRTEGLEAILRTLPVEPPPPPRYFRGGP